GSGELGQVLASHLVKRYGVKHVVLSSRRGAEGPGARELSERLLQEGAQSVQLAACDVSDRHELAKLLGEIDRPLTGVFHLAAVLDDGVVSAQTPERLNTVFGPKLEGALHLDELTRQQDLAAFVMFSSAAGTLGSAGQSNYAAANAGLDALAWQR